MQSQKLTNALMYLAIAAVIFLAGYKSAEINQENASRQRLSALMQNSQKGSEINDLDFELFWETWDELEKKYIDEKKLDPKKMYYGAIKGMVASLEDPYTFFLTPEEQEQSRADLGGKFEGIGAQLGLKDNRIVVIAPLKESPAEKAGLRSGDYIVKVNGESTKGWNTLQAVSKIRGPSGSEVKLSVERGDKEEVITITRQEIKVPSVELTYETKNGNKVAHVKLIQFGDTTNDEWDEMVNKVQAQWQSGEIKGMVLDLRDNPGGYLESSVYTASEFLQRGQVVVKQESTTTQNKTYEVSRNGRLQDIPLTVLINNGSASASEILSGALRDHKRATLIGEKSFGKGSVQQPLELSKGAGLHVTIAKWILPNGEWINGKGIEPEIKVENELKEGNTPSRADDKQLDKAIETVLTK